MNLSSFLRLLTEKTYDKYLDKKRRHNMDKHNSEWGKPSPRAPVYPSCGTHPGISLSFLLLLPSTARFSFREKICLAHGSVQLCSESNKQCVHMKPCLSCCHLSLKSDTAELSHFIGINLLVQPEATQIHLKRNLYEGVSCNKCHSGLSCSLWFQDLAETPE